MSAWVMSFATVSSPVRTLRVTGAPLEVLPDAEVAVGSDPELEAVVAVGSEPVEPVAAVGVSVAPPQAESNMAKATANGATCKVMRLLSFIAVLFLHWK